ncbi:hypothetical protein GCM10018785_59320 [Streptomyces longispororuber]|uniref:Uncharacterized protein n=1 Tax=Streptomyces longispororuber TaxID=68230 RepID=A0A919A3P9_9ACTN|nr:hypothetical protein [Streptomyces longispororuber]GHE83501.1 hypothetical protein GCM10018785_59320 [Streptomyces longispororuber]
MYILTIALLLVLIVLGFNAPLLWLVAAAIAYFLVRRHDRATVQGGAPRGGVAGGTGGMSTPASYRDYRIRRARQERWDRRYRRTHPTPHPRR